MTKPLQKLNSSIAQSTTRTRHQFGVADGENVHRAHRNDVKFEYGVDGDDGQTVLYAEWSVLNEKDGVCTVYALQMNGIDQTNSDGHKIKTRETQCIYYTFIVHQFDVEAKLPIQV